MVGVGVQQSQSVVRLVSVARAGVPTLGSRVGRHQPPAGREREERGVSRSAAPVIVLQ